jgi:glycyl-tRNA synthetase alpha chain
MSEIEHSKYNFEFGDTKIIANLFELYEKESWNTIKARLVLPAFDYTLKCSHAFNLLDSRGAISVTERTAYITRIRRLARECAKLYVEQRENMGYPLLKNSKSEIRNPKQIQNPKIK